MFFNCVTVPIYLFHVFNVCESISYNRFLPASTHPLILPSVSLSPPLYFACRIFSSCVLAPINSFSIWNTWRNKFLNQFSLLVSINSFSINDVCAFFEWIKFVCLKCPTYPGPGIYLVPNAPNKGVADHQGMFFFVLDGLLGRPDQVVCGLLHRVAWGG